MKIFISSLFFLFCITHLPAQSRLGAAEYRLSVAPQAAVTAVLAELERRYELQFAFPAGALAGITLPPRTIRATNVNDLLRQLFTGTGIEYQLQNHEQVLLRYAPPEELLLSGQVIDGAGGRPLDWVAVVLDTLNLGATTDDQGRFQLTIPANLHDRSVTFQLLGYRPRTLTLAAVRAAPVLRLQPVAVDIPEITVVEALPSVPLVSPPGAGLALRLDHLVAPEGLGPDIMRKVQLLHGITAHSDNKAGLQIRGSDRDGTLLVLDGIPIHRAEHFDGMFSAINAGFVHRMDLYKNTLPVAYGGKTGGMLLLESADEVTEPALQADVNLLTAAATAALPLGRHVDLLLGGRTTLGNAADSKLFEWTGTGFDPAADDENLMRRQLVNVRPDFRFRDFNLRLDVEPGEDHQLSLSAYHSRDTYLNSYENSFLTRLDRRTVRNDERFRNTEDWSNTGAALRYRQPLGRQSWQLHGTLFYTHYTNAAGVESGLTRSLPLVTQEFGFRQDQQNELRDLGARLLVERPVDLRRSGLTFGGEVQHHTNDYAFREEDRTILAGRGQFAEGSLFGAWRHTFNRKLTLASGGRLTYYEATGRLYAAPHLEAQYQLSDHWRAKTAYGIAYQFVRPITHENRLGRSIDFLLLSDGQQYPVVRADQYMLGATWQRNGWMVDVEGYIKDLDGVVEHALLTPGFARGDEPRPSRRYDYRIFRGTGRTIGLDAMLALSRGPYEGWIAYTLSRSTQRFAEVFRNEPYPTAADRRHQLKWVNAVRTGPLQWGAGLIYSSGRPYTDPSLLDQLRDRRDIDPAERIRRLPAYLRLDLSVTYAFPLGTADAALSLSVFNLTNRNNVDYRQYIYALATDRPNANRPTSTVIGAESGLVDRTVNVSLRVGL